VQVQVNHPRVVERVVVGGDRNVELRRRIIRMRRREDFTLGLDHDVGISAGPEKLNVSV
jgi:hypothetical protein